MYIIIATCIHFSRHGTVTGASHPRSPNQLQADKDFHSKTTVLRTFAYPTAKFHSRTQPLIRPFKWFEELNVLFSTTEAMTLPLNWAFSCYRTQHPTGVAVARARIVDLSRSTGVKRTKVRSSS